MNEFKVCVDKSRKRILCHEMDIDNDYNEIPLYEKFVNLSLDAVMSGDVVKLLTDKDVQTYTRDFTESEIDIITQKEMLEILLEQTKGNDVK